MAEGDIEQAKRFEPIDQRNSHPADFELNDLKELENLTFKSKW
jgi:hypothetical protein